MKRIFAFALLSAIFAVSYALPNSAYSTLVKEIIRPAFSFTSSRSLVLEKIKIDDNVTELCFSVAVPGKLPDLTTDIYILTDCGSRVPFENTVISDKMDSVKLVFRTLPRSVTTFNLMGCDKGWYGIRTDGKSYPCHEQDQSIYAKDASLPEYNITGDTAYVSGNIIGFIPNITSSRFFATQDLITALNDVSISTDSVNGNFSLKKQGHHNHAVYCVFPGNTTGDFWFFPGYHTTVTVDLPSIMARKYTLSGCKKAGKGVTFGGPVGDLSQVLWDLTHMDWRVVIESNRAKDITFDEYKTIHWDTLQLRQKDIRQSKIYNNRQKQLALLFVEKEYVRNIVTYPSWLKNVLKKTAGINVDSLYSEKIKGYTLKDEHATEIKLFDDTTNSALWLIRDVSVLPYAEANEIISNPAAQWMLGFRYAQKMSSAINKEPFESNAPEWDSVASPFVNKLREFNDFMSDEITRLRDKLDSDVKVYNIPEGYKGSVLDYIVSQNKGKIILVDCWATWCGPCKRGIEQMKEYKAELKDAPIVFVYLTDGSSPFLNWSNAITSITGNHYRLSSEEWNTLPQIKGIPRYFLIDEKGSIVMDVAGWGNDSLERFKSKINELLGKIKE